jgi:hypothetical protein
MLEMPANALDQLRSHFHFSSAYTAKAFNVTDNATPETDQFRSFEEWDIL